MIVAPEEKRSQGPFIAFIDLLFLLVAFLVLILFFVRTTESEAEVRLEATQEQLAVVQKEKTVIEAALAQLAPIMEKFAFIEHKEAMRRRALAARDLRRKARPTVRLNYRIRQDGTIFYRNEQYSLAGFKEQVVDRLRKDNWVAFHALAAPATQFGKVVAFRRKLLKNSGEFDTYWDNLTRKK
ncbi:MAG: hypothetical protein O7G32_01855 [SAR324 cluster bacterium]|nr:hypothetical protein [SAR324 cluster bacterium]